MNKNTRAHGKRLVRLAKDLFEERGACVETAPQQSKFAKGMTFNIAGDYFGIWDLIVVWKDGRRGFVQVTTWNHATDRRNKILDKLFPCTEHDRILGYVEGNGRHFRVLTGPDFKTEHSEKWYLDPDQTAEPSEEEVERLIELAQC